MRTMATPPRQPDAPARPGFHPSTRVPADLRVASRRLAGFLMRASPLLRTHPNPNKRSREATLVRQRGQGGQLPHGALVPDG